MNKPFHEYLKEQNIICGIHSVTGSETVELLCKKIAAESHGLKMHEIYNAVMARENILSTVVMPGLAIPHARMPKVRDVHIALGTSYKGIDFSAPKMPPVNIVVLILSPDEDPSVHFQVLYALANEFKKPGTVQSVLSLPSPAEIIHFFTSRI